MLKWNVTFSKDNGLPETEIVLTESPQYLLVDMQRVLVLHRYDDYFLLSVKAGELVIKKYPCHTVKILSATSETIKE